MNNPKLIVGAGFAGLLAAHVWPDVPLVDSGSGPRKTHKALLRFRSQAVSELTGIPFKPVTVRKGIFNNGDFVAPNIAVCNAYARKVIGTLVDRSIWDVSPAQRWMPPEDFQEQLYDVVDGRITWGCPYSFGIHGPANDPVISTMPLPATLMQCAVPSGIETLHLAKDERPIRVTRWKVPGSNVHQTVYYPDDNTSMYRASLCGDLLIVESIPSLSPAQDPGHDNYLLAASLNVNHDELEFIDASTQPIGKLRELPEELRRKVLCELTLYHRIYSLGRFATWRNILLDDVVSDLAVIRRLLRSDDYTLRKQYA